MLARMKRIERANRMLINNTMWEDELVDQCKSVLLRTSDYENAIGNEKLSLFFTSPRNKHKSVTQKKGSKITYSHLTIPLPLFYFCFDPITSKFSMLFPFLADQNVESQEN